MATPDRVSLSSGSSLIGQPLGIVDSPSGSPRRSFSAERPPVASRHGHASPARARAVQQSQSDSEGGANGNGTGVPLRVAYQGVPGAYSEMAAMRVYPGCSPVPCDQFDDAFNAVEQWLVGRAVLPIENSLGGSIHRNYDLLLRHRLHIVGEVHLPVHHCLLALPGSTPGQLTRVLSHPQVGVGGTGEDGGRRGGVNGEREGRAWQEGEAGCCCAGSATCCARPVHSVHLSHLPSLPPPVSPHFPSLHLSPTVPEPPSLPPLPLPFILSCTAPRHPLSRPFHRSHLLLPRAYRRWRSARRH
ncbi:unnamed protein product [Closterium sp. NIES-53]